MRSVSLSVRNCEVDGNLCFVQTKNFKTKFYEKKEFDKLEDAVAYYVSQTDPSEEKPPKKKLHQRKQKKEEDPKEN